MIQSATGVLHIALTAAPAFVGMRLTDALVFVNKTTENNYSYRREIFRIERQRSCLLPVDFRMNRSKIHYADE